MGSDCSFITRIKVHPLMVVSLSIIIALALGTIAYFIRPAAEAGIVVEIDDDALGKLILEAVPGFPYDPPSAEGVAVWLLDQVAKADALNGEGRSIVFARGRDLHITTHGRASYQAIALAEAFAEHAMKSLATYRPKLRKDLTDWIEHRAVESTEQVLPPDDERLAAHFEAALTEETRNIQDQLASSASQTGDISEPADIAGKRTYPGLITEFDRLIVELDLLRKGQAKPKTVDVDVVSLAEMFEARKNALLTSEAWAVPVSRISEPATLSPRPLHDHPLVLIPGILLMALVTSILATLLYDRHRPNNSAEPNPEAFADPYWPAPGG